MNTSRLEIGNYAGGLGDFLVLTSVFKVFTGAKLWLYEHEKCRRNSVIFDGLCEIAFTTDMVKFTCPESSHPNQAQKKIEGLGIADKVNCIPMVRLTDEEVQWAWDTFGPYGDCIAFVADTNGSHDPTDWVAKYRVYPGWDQILGEYRKRFTILQFGLTGKTVIHNEVDEFVMDMPIRKTLAAFSVIGRYLGVDTGLYHAMLSVGGKCNLLVPRPAACYSHAQWHYTPDLWKDEPCRVRYFGFHQAKECMQFVDSLN